MTHEKLKTMIEKNTPKSNVVSNTPKKGATPIQIDHRECIASSPCKRNQLVSDSFFV